MNLIDTNVLSEVRHPRGSRKVKDAFRALGNDLRISAIVLGEIRFGVVTAKDEQKRAELAAWYARLLGSFSHAVLPVTLPIAEIWGDLAAAARRDGRSLHVPDGLIAATALMHDLTLWTRNTRDFAGTGVRLFNPWED
jgi:predicted nucleic acid-binding protein